MTDEAWAAIEQPYRIALAEHTGMLLTTTEAAKRRGVDPKYMLRLCQQGKVPAIKVGGRWLIDSKDLDTMPPRSKRGRPPKDREA